VRVTGCCECGGDTASLIAINSSRASDYAALVCDGNVECALCLPAYPETAAATCQSGHCILTLATGIGG
jgi:hypothetical protein